VSGTHDYVSEMYQGSVGIADGLAAMICSAVPGTEVAPLGIGITVNMQDICGGIKDFAAGMLENSFGMREANFMMGMETEDWGDCNPLQTNFARLFCDVHCVRDAVVRGDRSILRNMKTATDITNRNLDKMSSWIVETTRVDAGWLGDKMDYSDVVNGFHFQEIKDAIAGGSAESFLLATKDATTTLQKELQGFGETASFSAASKLSARDALEKFALSKSARLEGPPNSTQAMSALSTLASLHSKLKGASDGRSKTELLSMRIEKNAHRMQDLIRLQRQTLGVYRQYSNMSHKMVRSMQAQEQRRERHRTLIELDRVWWQFRGQLDDYLDVAEEEIDSFNHALTAMSDYQHCSSGYTSLLSTYKRTMATTDKAHQSLKRTWRHSEIIFGELASIIVDAEAFATFFKEDGCKSTFAEQTVRQARLAVGGMKMLQHRFEVSGLPVPDAEGLATAVNRIQDSLTSAKQEQGCQ